LIASDNASNNPPYTAGGLNLININGGSGFQAWTAPPTDGTAQIANGPVFEVKASGVTAFALIRPFTGTLNQGDTFSALLVSTDPSNAFDAEIILYASGVQGPVVYWNGSEWGWSDGQTVFGASTGVTSTSNIPFSYAVTSPTTYSMSFGTYSTTGTLDPGISEVGFRVANGTTMQVNSLQIVPEPSTYAMLLAGGMAAVGAAIRRRRRHAASAL
jgi:hypothetical protein